MQLGTSINYRGPINTSITAVSTDRMCVCVCDIIVRNYDSTNISDGLECTALCVAVREGNLCLFCYWIDRGLMLTFQLDNEYSAVAEFEDKNILCPITNCGSEYVLSYIGGWMEYFTT